MMKKIFGKVLGLVEMVFAVIAVLVVTVFIGKNPIFVTSFLLWGLITLLWAAVFTKGFYNTFRPPWSKLVIKPTVIAGACAEIIGGLWITVDAPRGLCDELPLSLISQWTSTIHLVSHINFTRIAYFSYIFLVISASAQLVYYFVVRPLYRRATGSVRT